jgi:DNA-binding response OmpR family regulator
MPLPSRVLIIEDEFLIAMDLEMILQRTGISQVRLTGELQEAIDLIQAESWEAAILDANLGGRSSEPIAIKLSERRIPFVVVTGYDIEKLPPRLREARVLQKPIQGAALLESLTLKVANW